MATKATDLPRLSDTDIGWPLEELWVTDNLLDTAGEVEVGERDPRARRARSGPAVAGDAPGR